MHSLGLAGTAADLGKEQVDTEQGILVVQRALQFTALLAEHIGGVTDTTDNTQTTSVSDRHSH